MKPRHCQRGIVGRSSIPAAREGPAEVEGRVGDPQMPDVNEQTDEVGSRSSWSRNGIHQYPGRSKRAS